MRFIILGLLAALLAGCGPAVQNIPVSSNPSGAQVYADGQAVCITPCTVELTKDQDHILTIRKEGYQQADAPIKREYQTMQVLRNSAASGIRSATGVAGSNEAGAANALLNMGYEEESGRAYVLTPTTVTIQLAPTGGAQKSDQTSGAQPARSRSTVSGTQPTQMGDDLKGQDASEVTKEVLKTGAAVGAAAAPSVTAKTGGKSSHTSESFSPDGSSYTKKTTSTSTKASVSVNPVGAALGAVELIEKLAGDKDGGESEQDDTSGR